MCAVTTRADMALLPFDFGRRVPGVAQHVARLRLPQQLKTETKTIPWLLVGQQRDAIASTWSDMQHPALRQLPLHSCGIHGEPCGAAVQLLTMLKTIDGSL